MKKIFNNVGGYILGISILLAFTIVKYFSIHALVIVADSVLNWLNWFPWKLFVADLLILLPLGFFYKTRKIAAIGMILSSVFFGIILWLESLYLTYSIWGAIWVYIGLFFLGIGVFPIAILATIFSGSFIDFGGLIIYVAFILVTRLLGSRYLFLCKINDFEL